MPSAAGSGSDNCFSLHRHFARQNRSRGRSVDRDLLRLVRLQQLAIHRHRVVHRCRKRMLRCQPVERRHHRHSRVVRNRNRLREAARVRIEAAAMQIQQHLVRICLRHMQRRDAPHRHSCHGIVRHGHRTHLPPLLLRARRVRIRRRPPLFKRHLERPHPSRAAADSPGPVGSATAAPARSAPHAPFHSVRCNSNYAKPRLRRSLLSAQPCLSKEARAGPVPTPAPCPAHSARTQHTRGNSAPKTSFIPFVLRSCPFRTMYSSTTEWR